MSFFTQAHLRITRKNPNYYVRNYQRIMQNKPNFKDAQMNVNIYYTKVYNNETASGSRKNKPNSNPIKPNLRKAKMNVNLTLTKDYRKKDDFAVRKNKPNSNPISSKAKIAYRKSGHHFNKQKKNSGQARKERLEL